MKAKTEPLKTAGLHADGFAAPTAAAVNEGGRWLFMPGLQLGVVNIFRQPQNQRKG